MGTSCSLERLEPRRFLSAGGLDRGFGDGGTIIKRLGSSGSFEDVVTIQDGKLLVVGESSGLTTNYLAILRYTANGTLDTSFGRHGIIKFFPDAENATVNAFHVLPNGQMYVSESTGEDIDVVRLNSGGSIDSSYGKNGRVKFTGIGEPTPTFAADGSFLIPDIDANNRQQFLRYNPKGHPDNAFNVNAHLPIDIQEEDSLEYAQTADGGVLLVDEQLTAQNMILRRLDSEGNPLTSFGSGGKIVVPLPDVVATPQFLRVRPDGRFLLYIFENPSSSYDSKLPHKVIAFTADGHPDISFGTNGETAVDVEAFDMTVADDGSIALSGGMRVDEVHVDGVYGGFDFAVERLGANGKPDADFADNGLFTKHFIGGSDGKAVAVQADGKVVIAGDVRGSSFGDLFPMLVRLLGSDNQPVGGERARVQLVRRELQIRGTNQSDEIYIRSGKSEPTEIKVTANESSRSFSRSDIDRIVVNAGDGDDLVRMAAGLNIPMEADGGSGADQLFGGAARDELIGGPDSDQLFGNADADILRGGSGDDEIFGQTGSDRIYVGNGDDSASGGRGNDRFFTFDGTTDTVFGGSGTDTLLGDGDEIDGVEIVL